MTALNSPPRNQLQISFSNTSSLEEDDECKTEVGKRHRDTRAQKVYGILVLSFMSQKNSCFGREFHPTFDNLKWLSSVQVVLEPSILMK